MHVSRISEAVYFDPNKPCCTSDTSATLDALYYMERVSAVRGRLRKSVTSSTSYCCQEPIYIFGSIHDTFT